MKHAHIPDFSQPIPVRNSARSVGARNLIVSGQYIRPPDERLPGEDEDWQAVSPVRPDTAHSRSLRFLDASVELLTTFAIIGGGVVLSGFTLLV